LLTGDIIQVVQDRRYASFMRSYPNLIPRGPAAIQRILERIEPFSFERNYGAWWKANVLSDAKAAVRRSTERERLGAGADLHQGFARERSASTSWQDFPCA